ncbi:single-stranded DNA-binding protein [Rothia sp. AR01]|uniref:Single-stranded DNA-binding protein n=1 Tax=Rothia santali TaxID=2949643 RepID=A0A9X2HDS1_9MICC|nr:single-stranded DNA-binding protein [Rothia santali]MCP3425832.1 single-stranded DNA-binding protein [Rothia santali]
MARPNINDFRVTGNLVKDPEAVQLKSGKRLTTFTLAENNRQFNREAQQWEDGEPNYFDVAVDADSSRLGNLAQNVGESLHKGDRVSVEGSYTASPYVNKNGEAGINHKIWASEVSPSLMFASADLHQNPRAETSPSAQAETATTWEAAQPGSGGPDMG